MKNPEKTVQQFQIASGDAGDSPLVRKILARMLRSGALELSDLQTARDIMEQQPAAEPAAWLFLAAMFLSVRGGNVFLRAENGCAGLLEAGHLEPGAEDGGFPEADFESAAAEVWPRAAAAAKNLVGEFVVADGASGAARWFFRRDWSAAQQVSARLAELMCGGASAAAVSDAALDPAMRFEGFALNSEQVAAVRLAVRNRFAVITGGPGTGKTTIVCAVLRALMGGDGALAARDVAIVAPTGRAAQRMGEAIAAQCAAAAGTPENVIAEIKSLTGTTIHKLLGGYPPDWKHGRANPLPHKLVIADESSMIDIHLMRALLEALRGDSRLILLGDKDQLPPVAAGAVLGDVVADSGFGGVAALTQSHRFRGGMKSAAAAINRGTAEGFCEFTAEARRNLTPRGNRWLDAFAETDDTANQCYYFLTDGMRQAAVQRMIVSWAEYYGLLDERAGGVVRLAKDFPVDDEAFSKNLNTAKARELFAALDRSRILCVSRGLGLGVAGVNRLLYAKRFGKISGNDTPLQSAGIPVVLACNTPGRNLWNGDVGVTVRGKNGLEAIFPRGGEVVRCPVGLLPEHELGYAITVHKSQGSEFGNVLTLLPDDDKSALLTCPLIYTAITRAKKRAVVVGKRSALEKAVTTAVRRECGVWLGALV